jgi:hypothetical protein
MGGKIYSIEWACDFMYNEILNDYFKTKCPLESDMCRLI